VPIDIKTEVVEKEFSKLSLSAVIASVMQVIN
jgi:hypothetical protein